MKLLRPKANIILANRQLAVDLQIREVLQGLLCECLHVPSDEMQISRLAVGGQAQIFRISRSNETPLIANHRELILKLFNPAGPELDLVVDAVAKSMSRLHEVTRNLSINGWSSFSPEPMHFWKTPHAILMTRVPGRSLVRALESPQGLDLQTQRDIAKVVSNVLQQFWAERTTIYGDLTLHNLLIDVERKSVSFVDCGMPAALWECETVARQWYPASRDLAYLIFSVASAVRANLGKPSLRRRQLEMTGRLLHTCVNNLTTGVTRRSLLDEIHACAAVHLNSINSSPSPGGLWRAFVKHRAARCIDEVIGRLDREAPIVSPNDCEYFDDRVIA